MLQISQIEKPRCSATIDQIRLRRAMALPPEFQNFSSSGFQSAIHRVLRVVIEDFLSERALRRLWNLIDPGTFPVAEKQKPPPRGACASLQSGGVAYRPVIGPAARPAPLRLDNIIS